jgi:hypothetical protein
MHTLPHSPTHDTLPAAAHQLCGLTDISSPPLLSIPVCRFDCPLRPYHYFCPWRYPHATQNLPPGTLPFFAHEHLGSTSRSELLQQLKMGTHRGSLCDYRFSLAFQCVINIGARGSEPIRSHVVQVGTLDVVGPSSSATGMPRETREQRLARRLAHRNREEAAELARALERQIQVESFIYVQNVSLILYDFLEWTDPFGFQGEQMDISPLPSTNNISLLPSASNSDADTPTSADTSTAATPIGSNTPTGSVIVPGRDRSGAVIGRPVWDPPLMASRHRAPRNHHHHHRRSPTASPLADTSRPETETEDDGDGDVDIDRPDRPDTDDGSPSPASRPPHLLIQRPRGVSIVSDTPATIPIQVNTDAHIITNDARGGVGGKGEMGVEDGIVLLEANDDFAMGALPGAPSAIPIDKGTTPRTMNILVEAERKRNPRVFLPLTFTTPLYPRISYMK